MSMNRATLLHHNASQVNSPSARLTCTRGSAYFNRKRMSFSWMINTYVEASGGMTVVTGRRLPLKPHPSSHIRPGGRC